MCNITLCVIKHPSSLVVIDLVNVTKHYDVNCEESCFKSNNNGKMLKNYSFLNNKKLSVTLHVY